MPKKGRNIYKRKDGRWEARYIKSHDENGKAKYGYIYASSYCEARQKQRSLVPAIDEQDMPVLKKIQDSGFCNVAKKWLDMEKVNVKESSYSRYKRIVFKYLNPYFDDMRIEHISNESIREYILYLTKYGRLDGNGGLSNKTASDIIAVLKSIIKYAAQNHIPVQCLTNNIKLKKNVKDIQVIDRKEQEILTEYLCYNTNLTKLGVLISLYTGMRIGELCALKWSDINFEENFIEVTKTLQRIENFSNSSNSYNSINNPDYINNTGNRRKTKVIIGKPKSASSIRIIPLPGFLKDILCDFKTKGSAFVLTGNSRKFIEPRTMQARFKNIIADCGITQINFHVLRHTFATRCVEIGFDIKSLSEILGHSNVNMTLNKYVHSSFDMKRDNMEKLSQVL